MSLNQLSVIKFHILRPTFQVFLFNYLSLNSLFLCFCLSAVQWRIGNFYFIPKMKGSSVGMQFKVNSHSFNNL